MRVCVTEKERERERERCVRCESFRTRCTNVTWICRQRLRWFVYTFYLLSQKTFPVQPRNIPLPNSHISSSRIFKSEHVGDETEETVISQAAICLAKLRFRESISLRDPSNEIAGVASMAAEWSIRSRWNIFLNVLVARASTLLRLESCRLSVAWLMHISFLSLSFLTKSQFQTLVETLATISETVWMPDLGWVSRLSL